MLEHYASRLVNLQDDAINLGNNILKDDLRKNADDALIIANSLRTQDPISIRVAKHREVVCAALMCYIKDLEDSIKSLSDKLGGASPRLEGMQKEIRLTKEAKDEICNLSPSS